MTEFIYQQTIVQWRIPILENGKLGTPEFLKKYTTEFNTPQGTFKSKKGPNKKVLVEEAGEEYA